MKVILYTKTGCAWAAEVRDFLKEHDVPYEERNMTQNPKYAEEAEAKSGDAISPTLDIDGHIIGDADVEDVAQVLEQRGALH